MTNLSFAGDIPKSAAPVPVESNDTPAAATALRHALVADDEALIRWSVAETLADLGMSVQQAADAAGTLKAIDEADQPFDVVVLDLRMPDVDDLSLVTKVCGRLPSATVILMTAFGTPEIVAGAQELGVRAVIGKPFELDHLRRLLGPREGLVS